MATTSNKFIILIDGPKGSGKSTLRKLLAEKLENAEFLSLDRARAEINAADISKTEQNELATQRLLDQAKGAVDSGKSVVVDSGLTEERLARFESLASELGVSVRKYSLTAPYEVLLERVRARDEAKGKETDLDRFNETYKIQQARSNQGFQIFDTDAQKPDEIVDEIISSGNGQSRKNT